jgi:hypothetical protein
VVLGHPGDHATLRRTPNDAAIAAIGGAHINAWESPVRRIRVFEDFNP